MDRPWRGSRSDARRSAPGSRRRRRGDATPPQVRLAAARGVTFFDTADVYCYDASEYHYSERLLARALADAPPVVISTKGGLRRRGAGTHSGSWQFGHKLAARDVRARMDASREALGRRHAMIWSLHNADGFDADAAEFHAVLEAMRDACDAGATDALGLSNAGRAHVEVAARVLGDRFVAVQDEYSLYFRQPEHPPTQRRPVPKKDKTGVLAECARRNVAFVAFGVFGGLKARQGKRALRVDGPRGRASPQDLVLAWLATKSLVALTGARRREHVVDPARIAALALAPNELRALEAVKPKTR